MIDIDRKLDRQLDRKMRERERVRVRGGTDREWCKNEMIEGNNNGEKQKKD